MWLAAETGTDDIAATLLYEFRRNGRTSGAASPLRKFSAWQQLYRLSCTLGKSLESGGRANENLKPLVQLLLAKTFNSTAKLFGSSPQEASFIQSTT
jgi:hypothetical protein